MNKENAKCNGSGTYVVHVKYTCSTCDGKKTVLGKTCTTCQGTGEMDEAEERKCPGCVNCKK